MHKVLTVVQARLGSTRLPGKVLLPLIDKPMVEHIVERITYAKTVDAICIATSDAESDEPLVAFAEIKGWPVVRAPVDDLVLRLHRALTVNDADIMVRCWGDCPCVDPAVIDLAIQKLLQDNLDFVSNSVTVGRSYPYGLDIEVYRREVLAYMAQAVEDPFYREFPSEFVKQSGRYRLGEIRCEQDYSNIFVTVDYPEDLALVRALYQDLYPLNPAFGYQEIVDWVTKRQEQGALHAVTELPRNIEYYEKKQNHDS